MVLQGRSTREGGPRETGGGDIFEGITVYMVV